VITGTGRAGSTLLVQILDALGLDTGMESGRLAPYMPSVRAGLECAVDAPGAPTVVKDMTLGFRMRAVLDSGQVDIAHVIIPTRRLDIATASRIRAANYGRLPFRRGALTGTIRTKEQQQVLEQMSAEILDALEDHGVQYTLIEFPRFATDAAYIHETLSFLLPGSTLGDFERALDSCVRPELIHEAPLSRRERWKTRVTSLWMDYVKVPVGRFRAKLNPEAAQERLRASVAASREREAKAAAREAAERTSRLDVRTDSSDDRTLPSS
jgi:hypothetical protein